jgi:hypothetical protein
MNLLGRAAQAAEELDNRWTKDATIIELRGLTKSAELAGDGLCDSEIARRIRARVDCRRRLGLPAVDCTARKPRDCQCLTNALVELEVFASPGLAKVTKKELLARSSMLHKATPKQKPKPKPAIARLLAQMPAEASQSPQEPPPQSPEAPPPSPPPPPRRQPVKRTPKWFDEDDRGSIIDRIF